MTGFYSLLLATLLMLGHGSIGPSLAQRPCELDRLSGECGVFLPTSAVCGLRQLLPSQMQQIRANQAVIDEIEAIGGPVYEGTTEAARLGLSLDNAIVDLTFEQQEHFVRCEQQSLFTPNMSDTFVNPDGGTFTPQRRRRKRQVVDNTCCAPSPNVVRILASVTANGNAVQVVQPPGLAQFFQDIRFCPPSAQCGSILCGAVEAMVPAEVLLLNPPRIGREYIVVNICGGTTL